MKKTRADAVIDKLPRNQREALDRWLFEENVSYDVALDRLWKDFGKRVGRSALSAYWQRCKQRELLATIATSSQGADEVSKTFAANSSKFYEPMMKLIERLAFEKMLNGEQVDTESVADLTNLLQSAQVIELKRQEGARKESELALAREKFQFDAAKACLKQLPALKVIANDSKLDEQSKLRAVREKLFGILPE